MNKNDYKNNICIWDINTLWLRELGFDNKTARKLVYREKYGK